MLLLIKAGNMVKKVTAVVGNQQGTVGPFGFLDMFGQMDSGVASPFHYNGANDEIKYRFRVCSSASSALLADKTLYPASVSIF